MASDEQAKASEMLLNPLHAEEQQEANLEQDCDRNLRQQTDYNALLKAEEFDMFFDITEMSFQCFNVVSLVKKVFEEVTGRVVDPYEGRWAPIGLLRNM